MSIVSDKDPRLRHTFGRVSKSRGEVVDDGS